jgi:hypothetical protein
MPRTRKIRPQAGDAPAQDQAIVKLVPPIKLSEVPKGAKMKITYGRWSITIDATKEVPIVFIEYFSDDPWGLMKKEDIDLDADLRGLVEKWMQWIKDPLGRIDSQAQRRDRPQDQA